MLTIGYKNLKLRREIWRKDTNLRITGIKTVTGDAIINEVSLRENVN